MGDLADSVVKAAAEGLPARGTKVLVACSGGADSVALTAAAAQVADAVVGHVDHGLRPESSSEAEQVCAIAARLGVPFVMERLQGLDVRKDGLEAAARGGRYAALARLASQAGARFVATAHTRRDQAETLLLRLIRGAGPGALAGVRKKRELVAGIWLIRPLLGVSRQATEAVCVERGLPYLSDPHNTDVRRSRARVRALWSALAELNPRLEEALSGAAQLFADEDALLESLLPADLRLETLRALHPALLRRTILKAASAAGVRPERHHLEVLRKVVQTGAGAVDMPGGRAIIDAAGLRFERRPDELAIPAAGS